MPEVSIIVPTFNRPHLLDRALCSIMQQTFADFEVIVVNDAGCDVAHITDSFSDDRIKPVTHKQNSGLPASRNSGIAVSSGKYIAYLDDDDVWYSHHLEVLLSGAKSNQWDFIHSECNDIIETDQGTILSSETRNFPPFHKSLMKRSNYIPVCCILHEKSLFDKVGNFDDSIQFAEDWDMWYRASQATSFNRIKTVTCEYRKRDSGNNMNSLHDTDTNKKRIHDLRFQKYNIVTEIRKNYQVIPCAVLHLIEEQFKNVPLYVYGAGTYFEQIIPAIKKNVQGVFDGNASSIKERIKQQHGIEVLPLEKISSVADAPILSTVVDHIADVLQVIYSQKENVDQVYFLDDYFDLI